MSRKFKIAAAQYPLNYFDSEDDYHLGGESRGRRGQIAGFS